MRDMASDLFANASLFTPSEPESLEALDIKDTVIAGLILRLMYMNSRMVAHEIAAEVCLPFYNIVESILTELKESRRLIQRSRTARWRRFPTPTRSPMRAARAPCNTSSRPPTSGPAPISVDAYTQIDIAEQEPRGRCTVLRRPAARCVSRPRFRRQDFGSGRPGGEFGPLVIFLYGPPAQRQDLHLRTHRKVVRRLDLRPVRGGGEGLDHPRAPRRI